ncbi:hypothetical protein [Salinibacillus xinjiangensis]|uniref:Uncharacterized protein n=1 Tax=Salinibacillus xinjiangensis TaxID=1229268 RepID=A0A6G1X2U6_9BACI|nr:hypothetical protein [Salinibacillus xinjiangensis]MRG85262.1 hypothetical protein [Salinibacillus xinjiangensis]
MSVSSFINTYDDVQVWRSKSSSCGSDAGFKAQELYSNYKYAAYDVWTPITGDYMEQYCTKFVWQSYYYGTGRVVNLGELSLTKYSVPPHWILDDYYLTKVEGGL